MPTLYERDPVSGNMVPLIGGTMVAAADAKYVKTTGANTITGTCTMPTNEILTSGWSGYGRPDKTVVTKDFVDKSEVGMMLPYAGGSAPSGWFLCQGQEVSRTTYANLFAAIGTIYGVGNSSTTFNLPNMIGRIPVGVEYGGYFPSIGTRAGSSTHTLSAGQVPYMSGQFVLHDSANRTMLYYTGGDWTSGQNAPYYRTGYQNPGSSGGRAWVDPGFGNGAHNNIMWSFCLNFIIRT